MLLPLLLILIIDILIGVNNIMFKITNEKEVQPVGCVLPNTLVHGDCLEVMKYIPDNSIDLVLADPPYG